MKRQIGYSDDGARRVAKATRWVENNKRTKPLTPRNDRGLGDWKFFAEIIGQDTTDKRKYSWKMLSFQDLVESTDVVATNEGYRQGHWDWMEESEAENNYLPYAVDIHGSEYVMVGDIVELFPSPDQEYFWFAYNPGMMTAILENGNTISGGTETDPGYGNVVIDQAEWTDDVVTMGSNEITLKVYNTFPGTVIASGEDKKLHLTYCPTNRFWLVTGDPCGV